MRSEKVTILPSLTEKQMPWFRLSVRLLLMCPPAEYVLLKLGANAEWGGLELIFSPLLLPVATQSHEGLLAAASFSLAVFLGFLSFGVFIVGCCYWLMLLEGGVPLLMNRPLDEWVSKKD